MPATQVVYDSEDAMLHKSRMAGYERSVAVKSKNVWNQVFTLALAVWPQESYTP